MFSDNEKISNSQIKKLLVFDMISVSIIILPEIAASGAGRDGLTAIVLASLAAIVYSLFFLFASAGINGEYMDFSAKTMGGFFTFVFGALYIIKILFSCWFALVLFSKVINDTLLPNTNVEIIIFTLILVSAYLAAKGIEVRARIAEVFFFIVIVPLIILFIFGFKGIEPLNLFPLFTVGASEILYASYSVTLTYSAVEILLFAPPAIEGAAHKSRRYKAVIQAVLITAAINLILFILVLGLLGLHGASRQFKSSIMIMQMIQIPGGFIQRQDSIMLAIWMISVFPILSAYFYYLSKITNSLVKLKNQNYYIIFFGVLLFAVSFIQPPLETIFRYYGKYMAYIGLPQSVCIPLIIIIVSKIRARKGRLLKEIKKALISMKISIFILPLILLITGCSDLVEVQDRDFALALGVSLKDGKYALTFALPNLSALAKEDTGGENNGDSGRTATYESVSLTEIEDLYNHGSNKRLDYRHLEALILDKKISSSSEKLPALFEYVENNYEISRNVRVFYYEGDVKELIETKGEISGSIGDYLQKLENNNQRKNNLPPVTIGNLMDSYYQKKGIIIPLLELKEDKLEVNGAAVFQDSVYSKKLTDEGLKIYYVIKGMGKDFNFHTDSGNLFKIKELQSKTKYFYNEGEPSIRLAVTGIAEILTESGNRDAAANKEINNFLKNAVLRQIKSCLKEDKIDYANFYDASGIKNRDIWLDYKNRREDFINDVAFDISVNLNLQ